MPNLSSIRIGQGYDLHALIPGGPLIIGGISIPFNKNLKGHSDADVLIHAIIDSLLGALALGNIGEKFPDSDPQYKGIPSIDLLKTTMKMINQTGFKIGNIDSVIICQEPKLNPHVEKMKETLAPILECELSQISIKPKTNEKLDSMGQGNSIACFCSCILLIN